jgi:hypothetical protein
MPTALSAILFDPNARPAQQVAYDRCGAHSMVGLQNDAAVEMRRIDHKKLFDIKPRVS